LALTRSVLEITGLPTILPGVGARKRKEKKGIGETPRGCYTENSLNSRKLLIAYTIFGRSLKMKGKERKTKTKGIWENSGAASDLPGLASSPKPGQAKPSKAQARPSQSPLKPGVTGSAQDFEAQAWYSKDGR